MSPLRQNGEIVGVIVVATKISDLKAAQADTDISHAFFPKCFAKAMATFDDDGQAGEPA